MGEAKILLFAQLNPQLQSNHKIMNSAANTGNSGGDLERVISHVTKVIETQIDQQIEKADRDIANLGDEDELKALRQRRMVAMKAASAEKEAWLANGHGKYEEITDEKTFFQECKNAKNLVVHFYREATFRCKIVDKHLSILAPKHLEAKFVKLDAEKSPFLTQRLNVRVLPTIAIVRNGSVADKIVGFTELGNRDDFETRMLEWRLGTTSVIDYDGDLMSRPDAGPFKPSKKQLMSAQSKPKRNLRSKEDDSDSDNDW